VVDPNFKNSYIESYNLNIQQQLSKNWSMMVGYFGSQGRHLRTRVNLNQFLLDATGHQIIVNGKPQRPFGTLSASSPIDPGATVGNISDNVSTGNSNYNALWISSDMRPWHGLQFNASYTYSKSLDYTSQNGQGVVIQNSLNPAGDKGLSDFDARQRFVINFLYALPFQGNRLVQGWQVGGIVSDQTGNPVNILANALGIPGYTGVGSLRPDLIGPIQMVKQPFANGSVQGIQWFANSVCDPALPSSNPASCASGGSFTFQIPDAAGILPNRSFHFGNFGRNTIIGPGFNNVDFSLTKRTKITERFTHEMRFEAFDVLNHPNFGQPGRTAQTGSGTFGLITSTRFPPGDSGSARQLQFAMKLIF
jgi:hypothetical protein